MSRIKILIVEDELITAQEMSNKLTSKGFEVLEIVDNANDARRALEVYQLDIVLIDIKLKGEEDGIDLALNINQKVRIPIIFITSHTNLEITTRAKLANPSAFLVKPYNQLELQIATDMTFYNYQQQRTADMQQQHSFQDYSTYAINDHVFIKDKHVFEKLEFSDIMWLKAENSYVSIITKIKNYLLTSDTLGSMLEKIDCNWIMRVHRSYAVNINMVDAIDGNQLKVNEELIPIGKNYRNVIKECFRIL